MQRAAPSIPVTRSMGNYPLQYLRLRPDCEGKLHQLASCTGQILPSQQSFAALTDARSGESRP
jgi:hypothetical protein